VHEFTNERVDAESLPRLRDEYFVPVHPNYLRSRLITAAVVAGIVVVGGGALAVVVSADVGVVLAGMLLVLGLIGAYAAASIVSVRRIAYVVRDHDLSYRSGVLITKVSTIPFVRVQHARIAQGPIQRMFSIATLEVNSAGPDLAIRGLSDDVAERLKALVVERAGELTEEV